MSLADVRTPNGVEPARTAPASPSATRLRRRGWRDPRLAVGLVLVAVSTLVGARLLAAADDSVPVWVAAGPVRAGDDAAGAELVPGRVRLTDGAATSVYLGTDVAPVGIFDRDLAAGELVPAAALQPAGSGRRSDVPLSVEPGDAPVDLAAGDRVDVWVVPDPEAAPTRGRGAAQRVLGAVPVAVAGSADSLGAARRQVVVGVDGGATSLGDVLGTLGSGRVVLVRVGD